MKITKTPLLLIFIFIFGSSFIQAQSWKDLKNKAKATMDKGSSVIKNKGSLTDKGGITKGHHYYISTTGHGKIAGKNEPAKEIGAIASKLKAGDVIHIAGGTYYGKLNSGSDELTVPVSIIGGYSPDFSSRDPWGKYKTIMTGTNEYMASTLPRISIKAPRAENVSITIDGLIIDHGPRNRYKTSEHLVILRKANAASGQNPSPENPGIKILVGNNMKVSIKNCIVMNTAPTQGAVDIQIGKDSKALIENNLIINNTGEGIMLKSKHHGTTGLPVYVVKNNTILFSWKHDEIASYGGNSIMTDNTTKVTIENNVLGFGDFGGINNIKKSAGMIVKHNLFVGHRQYDYQEGNAKMTCAEMDDYADLLSGSSGGNFSAEINIPLNKTWAERYFNREMISRAVVDASVKVSNSTSNQIRSMLGLNLQGSSVGSKVSVWLHQMAVEDAVKAGLNQYKGVGCSKP